MRDMTGDPRWLNRDEQASWRAYILGTTALLDQLDRELRAEHHISLSEYEILVRLSERPHRRLRMAVLAQSVHHSRSRVTHTITRMEGAGLVERVSAHGDGRGVDAVLTDHGMEVLQAAARTHVRGVREHMVDLASGEDFAALGRVFDAVCDQLMAVAPAEADIRERDHINRG